MIKRIILSSVLTLSSFSVMAADAQKPLNIGEHLALRSYTGQAIGLTLSDVLKAESVGIAVNGSTICTALAGAAAGETTAHLKGKDVMMLGVMNKPEDAASAYANIKDKAVIAVLFGGQTPASENAAMVKALLGELAKANYQGPIFLHLAVWVGKMAEKAASEDAAIAKYLANKDNVYALTVDKNNGKALVHKVSFKGGKQASDKIVHEVAMNETWLDLFKRSLLKRS